MPDGIYQGPFAEYLTQPFRTEERPTGVESGAVAVAYPIMKFFEGWAQAKRGEAERRISEYENNLRLLSAAISQLENVPLKPELKQQLQLEGLAHQAALVSEAAGRELTKAKHPVARFFANVLTGLTGGQLPKRADPSAVLNYIARIQAVASGAEPSAAATPQAPPPAAAEAKPEDLSALPASQLLDRIMRERGRNPNLQPHIEQSAIEALPIKLRTYHRDRHWYEDVVSDPEVSYLLSLIPERQRPDYEARLRAIYPSKGALEVQAAAYGVDVSRMSPAEAITEISYRASPGMPAIVPGRGLTTVKRRAGQLVDALTEQPVGENVLPVHGDEWQYQPVVRSDGKQLASALMNKVTGQMFDPQSLRPLPPGWIPYAFRPVETADGKLVNLMVNPQTGEVISHRLVFVDTAKAAEHHSRIQQTNSQLAQMRLQTALAPVSIIQSALDRYRDNLQKVYENQIRLSPHMPQIAERVRAQVAIDSLPAVISEVQRTAMAVAVASGKSEEEARREAREHVESVLRYLEISERSEMVRAAIRKHLASLGVTTPPPGAPEPGQYPSQPGQSALRDMYINALKSRGLIK